MKTSHRGFTLIEAVIVMAITGIIGGIVAVFMVNPIRGYFDSTRRAGMTDIADTALRRMSRDLRLSLPNSVRLTGTTRLELLLTRTGGRYRIEPDGGADPLEFGGTDATLAFDIVGPAVTFAANDQIVIYNLGYGTADAYAGTNRRAYNGAAGPVNNVPFTPNTSFPFDSPNHSFHVVETPVTYDCTAGNLTRYSGYTIAAGVPVLPAGNLLAQNVGTCIFSYAPGITERSGLVSLQLSITRDGETVTLYHEVHVSNAP
jgi:MSHA biogenesis protein MshO